MTPALHSPSVMTVVPEVSLGSRSQSNHVRLAELDALRGIAALMVVLYHFTAEAAKQDLVSIQVTWGGLGVQLFFVISGFVIVLTLNRGKSVADFVVSRFARLFPAYWLACLVAIGVASVVGWSGKPLEVLASAFNFTMFQGFVGLPSLSGVFWTLHIELAFYAFIAFLFANGWYRHAVPIMAALIALWWIATAAFSIDEFAFASSPTWLKSIRMVFPLLFHHLHPMPFFLLGVVLFNVRQGWSAMNAVGALVAALDIAWHTVSHRPRTEWVILFVVLGLALVATQRGALFLRLKPLVFLGTISYSLYLLHTAVGILLIGPIARVVGNANVAVMLSLAVAIVVGAAGAYLVEQPANSAIRAFVRTFQRRKLASSTA